MSNSELPDDLIYCISIDYKNNKWIGTWNGIARFDDTTWTIYNKENSGLPHREVMTIDVDSEDHKWIGTKLGGVAVYREGGVLLNIGKTNEINGLPDYIKLYQNYPNPFNPMTTIKYSLSRASYVELKIYDVLGKEISTLVNKHIPPGTYSTIWDATKFSSGVYFVKLQTEQFYKATKIIYLK